MTKQKKDHTPPPAISGVPVTSDGEPVEFRGERWVTLVPEDDEDERLWEFSLTTGRVVRTR